MLNSVFFYYFLSISLSYLTQAITFLNSVELFYCFLSFLRPSYNILEYKLLFTLRMLETCLAILLFYSTVNNFVKICFTTLAYYSCMCLRNIIFTSSCCFTTCLTLRLYHPCPRARTRTSTIHEVK